MTEYEQNIEIMKDLRNRIDAVLSTSSTDTKRLSIPDPLKHKYISFVKSGFRILAGISLCFGEFIIAGALLIVAELLGIAEELV
jgi:hypothetical protein